MFFSKFDIGILPFNVAYDSPPILSTMTILQYEMVKSAFSCKIEMA